MQYLGTSRPLSRVIALALIVGVISASVPAGAIAPAQPGDSGIVVLSDDEMAQIRGGSWQECVVKYVLVPVACELLKDGIEYVIEAICAEDPDDGVVMGDVVAQDVGDKTVEDAEGCVIVQAPIIVNGDLTINVTQCEHD